MAKTASPAKKSSATKRNAKKPTAKQSNKVKTAAKKSSGSKKAAGDVEITIDRRRQQRRDEEQSEANESVAAAKPERRKKVQRRRQIDPTTCERDYSEAEVEFMNAMDEYKRTSGRMFPTCSEVLEVLRSMGYEKLTAAELVLLGRSSVEEGAVEEGSVESEEVLENADDLATC